MSGSERRIHPRHAFDRAVFCYHDGTRISGKPIDISIGGMLFATPDAPRVPKGTQMGVVFDRSCGVDPPIYLFARVVRFQSEPVTGVGLRWVKATTAMEARLLATFLEILFGISASILLPHVELGQGRMRSSFEFEAFLRAIVERKRPELPTPPAGEPRVAAPIRTNLRDPEAGPIGFITRPEEVDALKVEVVPHSLGVTSQQAVSDEDLELLAGTPRKRPGPEPAEAHKPAGGRTATDKAAAEKAPEKADPGRRRPPSSGAEPVVDRPVAGDLPAVLEVGSERLQVRVTQFARAAFFVRTLVAPVDIDGVYPLRFAIATREGDVTLTATTRISEVRTGRNDGTPGLELEIVDLDEGNRPGLLSRYVKWLQSGSHGRA